MTGTIQTPFRGTRYVRHNARRLEHLATLGLPLSGRTVLELGAGIGDHTTYFLDRGCSVTVTEGREENIAFLRDTLTCEKKWTEGTHFTVHRVDLDAPETFETSKHDVVFNYGLLYHLRDPERLIAWAAGRCTDFMICETQVAYNERDPGAARTEENAASPTQAMNGIGSRPTRERLFAALTRSFTHVYMPATQPCHEEFPLDWTLPKPPARMSRAIFIGAHAPLPDSPLFVRGIPDRQRYA